MQTIRRRRSHHKPIDVKDYSGLPQTRSVPLAIKDQSTNLKCSASGHNLRKIKSKEGEREGEGERESE